MPIAHCYYQKELALRFNAEQILKDWCDNCDCQPEEISLIATPISQQSGKAYQVLGYLTLPDCWKKPQQVALQLALSDAICKGLALKPDQVIVMTRLLTSGCVVENGQTLNW